MAQQHSSRLLAPWSATRTLKHFASCHKHHESTKAETAAGLVCTSTNTVGPTLPARTRHQYTSITSNQKQMTHHEVSMGTLKSLPVKCNRHACQGQKPHQHLHPESCSDHQTTRMVCRYALGVATPFRHLISFEGHQLVARHQNCT